MVRSNGTLVKLEIPRKKEPSYSHLEYGGKVGPTPKSSGPPDHRDPFQTLGLHRTPWDLENLPVITDIP